MLSAQTTINYTESSDDFVNPERGFYRYSITRASNYQPLSAATYGSYRNLHQPNSGYPNFEVYSSLTFRYFVLDDFKTSSISQAFLDNMQADFDAARTAGVKVIPRISYTNTVNGSGCSSWICPPYGDAAKTWVLTHIAQIAPILEANKDVIATVQMGFIGVWGENYYTDYFGDAATHPQGKLEDANWQDRIDVLNSLLGAVPSERTIQVLYPQMKQRTIYGINALTNVAALTVAEAYQGTPKARLGFHNDCLFASFTDFGTYSDYGNSSSGSTADTTNLKPYFATDSQFVPVGGETCSAYAPFDDCSSTDANARADTELRRMHYSYLNAEYNHADVNSDWVGICMEDIKKNLGYRFVLSNGTYSDEAQTEQVISVDLNLNNKGFAAPYNPRGVELILRNTVTSAVWYVTLPDDPRYWFRESGSININHNFCIPNGMPNGTYELLLNLPDPQASIYDRPEYAIRLANALPNTNDVWEASTGYNNLGHTITINATAANASCAGELEFQSISSFLPIQLADLKVLPTANALKVVWTTTQELNNKGFNVQRSLNAKNFETIHHTAGKGTTSTPSDYFYSDATVNANTTYYYRLEQVDTDGTINYSPIVSGILDESTRSSAALARQINIAPNPADDFIFVRSELEEAQKIKVQVFDVLGHLLTENEWDGVSPLQLDTKSWAKGMVYVQVHKDGVFTVKKVVIR